MAKMICRCGNLLSTSDVPNDVQLMVYTDMEWDNILRVDTIHTWQIPLPAYDVWQCPKCKRIYVFEKGNSTPIEVFALEDNKVDDQ